MPTCPLELDSWRAHHVGCTVEELDAHRRHAAAIIMHVGYGMLEHTRESQIVIATAMSIWQRFYMIVPTYSADPAISALAACHISLKECEIRMKLPDMLKHDRLPKHMIYAGKALPKDPAGTSNARLEQAVLCRERAMLHHLGFRYGLQVQTPFDALYILFGSKTSRLYNNVEMLECSCNIAIELCIRPWTLLVNAETIATAATLLAAKVLQHGLDAQLLALLSNYAAATDIALEHASYVEQVYSARLVQSS